MKDNQFIANFLYHESVKQEIADRQNELEKHDYKILDIIINEINKLGYNLCYATDLRLRDFNDKRIIPIIAKYYLDFNNLGYVEDMIGIISKKGFSESIPIIIQLYNLLKKQEKLQQIASCDNAFDKIKDKSYINLYLEFLKNKEDAIRLPLTVLMLAKWKVPEAKEWFVKYLDCEIELLFISIEALGYYKDEESKKLIEKFSNHQNKDVRQLVKKVLSKF